MENSNALPLSIRDVNPGPGAIRLTGTTPNGLPSGFHTGGAWLIGDWVYKPLDGRPYANCENHYPTRELEVLELMKGKTLFPDNWREGMINGRHWLIRKKAYLIPEDIPYRELRLNQVLEVEQGVRALNRAKWEINDGIALAVDPDSYQLFLYDLSAAHPMDGSGCYRADEEWRIKQFFEQTGFGRIAKLRQHASHLITEITFWKERKQGYQYVYASFYRPFSTLWASLPMKDQPILVQNDRADWENQIPHTWIITTEPIPAEKIKSYELDWAWEPIHIGY